MWDDLVARALALPPGRRHLVALAGPPASGKSTRAVRLARSLSAAGRLSKVVPMDGFHLDNAILDARGLRARKGAPETFDLRGFTRLIDDLALGGEVVFPLFDRDRDLAVAGADVIPADCDLVVVEGNYLLLDAPGWRDLARKWSLSAFINTPPGVLRARLTDRWAEQGLDRETALAKVEGNDLPNAQLVSQRRLHADLIVSQ